MSSKYLFDLQEDVVASNDDDDDVIIESEEIIYLNDDEHEITEPQNEDVRYETNIFDDFMCNFKQLQLFDNENKNDQSMNGAIFNGKSNSSENGEGSLYNSDAKGSINAPEKLRYKQKYSKIDPNIIIEFFQYENTMIALKLLFDWLRSNNSILINCFTTNPEFIDKIFDLLNRINIDIFTRKVYFERRLIDIDDVRENLRMLFDTRQTIPLKEDVLLKEFSAFDMCQRNMDWTMPLKMNITDNEETILRIFMFVDFGFSLCKMKKFDYNFCSRTRNFIKTDTVKRSSKRVRKRGRRNRRQQRDRSKRNPCNNKNDRYVLSRNDEQMRKSSNEDVHQIDDEKKSNLKKGYLKNRQQNNQNASLNTPNDAATTKTSADKHEIMGKLWLQHEIEVLEAKMSKNKMILTPYLVVDTKVLTNHLDIVKRLVKAKKCVVLIPKAGERKQKILFDFNL